MFCRYNYSRDDEEIYKEVMEIANELIPHIMKVVSSGHSAHSLLKDPECFADLLRYIFFLCLIKIIVFNFFSKFTKFYLIIESYYIKKKSRLKINVVIFHLHKKWFLPSNFQW